MGYVYKRKLDGGIRFAIAYTDVDGTLRRELVKAETKAIARRLLAQAENEVDKAKLLGLRNRQDLIEPKSAKTFKAASDEFLKHHSDVKKKEKSADRDRYGLDLHILPVFGTRPIGSITVQDVEHYITKRLGSDNGRKGKVQASTVRNELATISGVFRHAIRSAWVDRNPVRDAIKPKMDNTIVRYLDPTEEEALLVRLPRWLREATVFALHTGLRKEEQCELKWVDVRFDERKIIVRNTKNRKDRAVDMNATVYELLEGMDRYTDSPYVFTNPETRTRLDRFNNKSWRKALVDAGVKKFRWHDLRHTFGSRLAQRGVPLTTIKELMGHSDISVTLRYAHMAPDNRRSAVRLLDLKPAAEPALKLVEPAAKEKKAE